MFVDFRSSVEAVDMAAATARETLMPSHGYHEVGVQRQEARWTFSESVVRIHHGTISISGWSRRPSTGGRPAPQLPPWPFAASRFHPHFTLR